MSIPMVNGSVKCSGLHYGPNMQTEQTIRFDDGRILNIENPVTVQIDGGSRSAVCYVVMLPNGSLKLARIDDLTITQRSVALNE